MRSVKIYHPPERAAPLETFISSLEPKLRRKLRRQFFLLANTPLCELKEPHYKHFVLEKYSRFYELREKGKKVLVRVIFTVSGEDILLLVPFIKRQPRDTMRALELRIHPGFAVNMKFKEEDIT
jgi:hypothetical protein